MLSPATFARYRDTLAVLRARGEHPDVLAMGAAADLALAIEVGDTSEVARLAGLLGVDPGALPDVEGRE